MIKYTMETTDEEQARVYMNAGRMHSVLWELDNKLRNEVKHGQGSNAAEYWRDELHALLNEHGVELV